MCVCVCACCPHRRLRLAVLTLTNERDGTSLSPSHYNRIKDVDNTEWLPFSGKLYLLLAEPEWDYLDLVSKSLEPKPRRATSSCLYNRQNDEPIKNRLAADIGPTAALRRCNLFTKDNEMLSRKKRPRMSYLF